MNNQAQPVSKGDSNQKGAGRSSAEGRQNMVHPIPFHPGQKNRAVAVRRGLSQQLLSVRRVLIVAPDDEGKFLPPVARKGVEVADGDMRNEALLEKMTGGAIGRVDHFCGFEKGSHPLRMFILPREYA